MLASLGSNKTRDFPIRTTLQIAKSWALLDPGVFS